MKKAAPPPILEIWEREQSLSLGAVQAQQPESWFVSGNFNI